MTLSVMLFAQAPQSFSYQTVIRDANWTVLDNQSVGIKISILEDVSNGTVVYEETHSATTSTIGLVNLSVGDGVVMTGLFNTIDWGDHNYFIEVAVDVTGGTSYIVMGTTQLRSVPYALYAENSGNTIWQQNSTNDISFGDENVRFWETTEGYRLAITGGTPLLLKRNKNIPNYGVPINFNLLNSLNEDKRYGQIVASIRDSTAGAEIGSLSFLVADGSGSWSNGYVEERFRVGNDRVTVKNVMNLEPLSTAPINASKGDMYMNGTTNKLMVYDGTIWQACW